ncbi:MAG: DinB family protein [Caldilineaceae bacterium]|nr:DinB family protein [Caldilineaceae bacterium]
MSLKGSLQRLYVEWSAKGDSYEELVQRLRKNESTTHARLLNATEAAWNRERASHVIGIERWGAQRLRTLLGEPLVMDEYDGYAPSTDLSMAELAAEFKSTRAATLALVNELERKGISLAKIAKHNELGDLSLGGWLAYISSHTARETLAVAQRRQNKTSQTTET